MDRFIAILILVGGIFIGWMTAERLRSVGDVYVVPAWALDQTSRIDCKAGTRIVVVGSDADICK